MNSYECHALASHHRFAAVISCTNAVFVFFLFFCFYVYMCLNVPPSPTYLRSGTLESRLKIEITNILPLTVLCICLTVFVFSNINLNCRFIPLNTRLNTLAVSVKANRNKGLLLFLLFMSYLSIFEYHFIIFLPCELWRGHLDTRRIPPNGNVSHLDFPNASSLKSRYSPQPRTRSLEPVRSRVSIIL